MTASACGSCTLCCTVMKVTVTDDDVKPAHVQCQHCTDQGCGIYLNRPDACSGFKCLWLASQDYPPARLAAELRPDRTGVVLDLNTAGYVLAHCEANRSWTHEPMLGWLLRMTTRTTVLLERPDSAHVLAADGSTERLIPIGVDSATRQRLYVRAGEMDAVR